MSDERRWRRFMRAHRRVTRIAQLEWLRHNPIPATPARSQGRWTIERLGANDILGVHGLEEAGGRRFRWTEAVVMLRIAPPADCEIRIETGGIRGDPLCSLIAAVIGGRALPREFAASDRDGTLILHLPAPWAAAAKEGIVLVCDPLLPAHVGSTDQRELGLPIAAIAIEPSRLAARSAGPKPTARGNDEL